MTGSNSTTPDSANDLPAPLIAWLETALAVEISRKERSVSRREGWLVDIERTDGTRLEGFLRLERFDGDKIKRPICQVNHETAVIEALHSRKIPVPGVLAHDEELQATLFERLPGRDETSTSSKTSGSKARSRGSSCEDLPRFIPWMSTS